MKKMHIITLVLLLLTSPGKIYAQIMRSSQDLRFLLGGYDSEEKERRLNYCMLHKDSVYNLELIEKDGLSKLYLFPNIEYLRLRFVGNIFSTNPQVIDSILMLKKLENFSIFNNKIDTLPEKFCQLTQLKLLDIGNCRLKTIPSCIGNFVKLEYLIINAMYSKHQYMEIEDAVGANKMRKIPDWLFNLKKLRILQVIDCDLQEIDPRIGCLKNLEKLFLGHNEDLKVLPKSIKKLKKLRHLELPRSFPKTEVDKVKKWLPKCEIVVSK